MTTSTVSLGLIKTKVFDNIGGIESDLASAINGLTATPTTAELLNIQRLQQQWSMLIDLQATMTKTVSETMKGIVQKSG